MSRMKLDYVVALAKSYAKSVVFASLIVFAIFASMTIGLPPVATSATVADTASSNPAQLAGLAPVRELHNDNPAKRIENL
jgi:hypothetical protein